MKNVLVLNGDYSPLNITNMHRAIVLMLANKVEVLAEYDDVVKTAKAESYPIPSVVRLKYYVKQPKYGVALSRKNIHIRDNYTCQYCGKKVDKPTVDHIIPEKLGGKSTWENLVCCCYECNSRKGHKTLEQANLKLLKKPNRPQYVSLFKCSGYTERHPEWREFLPEWAN